MCPTICNFSTSSHITLSFSNPKCHRFCFIDQAIGRMLRQCSMTSEEIPIKSCVNQANTLLFRRRNQSLFNLGSSLLNPWFSPLVIRVVLLLSPRMMRMDPNSSSTMRTGLAPYTRCTSPRAFFSSQVCIPPIHALFWSTVWSHNTWSSNGMGNQPT